MSKIERLYGVNKAIWLNLEYRKALAVKNALANMVIAEINTKGIANRNRDDMARIYECVEAIDDNLMLMKE